MGAPEVGKVGPGALERPNRISREVTGHGAVEPERLTLVTVESRPRRASTREGFDLASPKAALRRAPRTGQHTLITQVNDMLARGPQDRGRFARADQIIVVHAVQRGTETQETQDRARGTHGMGFAQSPGDRCGR
jgi:hypothetical protein